MLIRGSNQSILNKTVVPKQIQSATPQNYVNNYWQANNFLREVLEGLEDGILIISQTGKLLHANASAYQFCYQLNHNNLNSQIIPYSIWKLCKLLVNQQNYLLESSTFISDEIVLNDSITFHIRVRLLDSHSFPYPCFVVTIQNRYESLKNTAIAEVKKYDLTPREAEIWVLYRGKYSYKEIAEKLYITINTVKKHMKNIHAKRQAFSQ